MRRAFHLSSSFNYESSKMSKIWLIFVLNCFIVTAQKSNNPWEFFRVGPDLRADPYDYPHHSHVGYHFPGAAKLTHSYYYDDHHHHDHPDHLHGTHARLSDDHSHSHGEYYVKPGQAPPGYPSSDFVKYFAKYTASGGSPKAAPHAYYAGHHGHLHNFNYEPENAVPRSQKLVQPKTDPFASHRNFIAAGSGFLYRADTGHHTSPTGEGPLNGFYYGPRSNGGKLYIGDRPFYY